MRQILVCTLILLFSLNSNGKTSMGFKMLAKAMLTNNNLVIESSTKKNLVFEDFKKRYSVNVPSFNSSINFQSINLFQDAPSVTETEQTRINIDASLSGRYNQMGLNYTIGFQYSDQQQDAFSVFPEYKLKGESYFTTLDIDLLDGAGFSIGKKIFEISERELKVADESLKDTVQDSLLNLSKLYLNARLSQQKLARAGSFLERAKSLYNSYKKLYDEGKFSKVELLSAQIQVNRQKSNYINLEKNTRDSLKKLFAFVGGIKNEKRIYNSKLESYDFKSLGPAVKPSKKTLNALNSRARVIDQRIKLSELRALSLENQTLPTLKLAGTYRRDQNPSTEPIIGEELASNRWSVGLSFSMPLSTIEEKANLQKELIVKKSLLLQRKLLIDNIEVIIEGLLGELQLIEKQLKITNESLVLANERYNAALPLVEINSNARLDILLYQNELILLENEKLELETNADSKYTDLVFAQGQLLPEKIFK